MLSEIDAALSLGGRFAKLIKWLKGQRTKEGSVASRFVRLFESHGVHRNQIPRVFGHNLTVADVAGDDTLLNKLTEEMLEDACKLFAVRREWLDGASSEIYPIHYFSKNIDEFTDFITQLVSENHDSHIRVILIRPIGKSYGQPALALLLFEEEIGRTGDKSYCRYHLSNEWIYSSGMVRGYLTAYIAKCFLHRKLHVFGTSASSKLIKSISEGKTILGWNGRGAIGGIRGEKWYPEDMALLPEYFLDGFDNSSVMIKEALGTWLKLESQGYMKLGLNTDKEKNARQLFEQELKKYSA